MLHATVNTTNTLRCTLKESIIDVPTFSNYLMRIDGNKGSFSLIIAPSIDVARYSEFVVDFSQDDAVNGAIQIKESGEYNYFIYGQTNATNLDYTNGVVVGLLEKGTIKISSGGTFFEDVSSALQKDVQL